MDLAIKVELFEKPGKARVERAIASHQRGRVFFQGTYWPARFYSSSNCVDAEIASWVTVIGRQGLTLLVTPVISAVCA